MRIKMAGAGQALLASLLPVSLAAAFLAPQGALAQQRPPAQTPAPATPAPAPAQPQATPPAAAPAPQQQAAPADPDALPPALAEFDANKDKSIDQKEFVAAQFKTFEQVDANKDGLVTREEYVKQAEPPFVPADAPNLLPIEERKRRLNLHFTNLDSNQDGKISREEAEQSFVREFVTLDRDKNGRITIHDLRIADAERRQGQQGEQRPVERMTKQEFLDNEAAIFVRLDENSDKSLTLAEFLALANGAPAANREQVKARMTTAYAEMDTNNDKKVSEAEWKVAAEKNFTTADRDKDGVLEAEEMRPPQQPAPVPEQTRAQFVNGRTDEFINRLDKNKDAKVSLEEFLVLTAGAPAAQAEQAKAQATTTFNGMDANKNGSVERSELVTYFTNIFNRIDANKDGKINQREIDALNNQSQQRPQQQQPQQQRPPATQPPAQPRPAQPQPRPQTQPAPQPAPQGGPPPAYPSGGGGQAPITTTPGSQPLR
jgi:Ca2+-binding EF-hand superfamily protein